MMITIFTPTYNRGKTLPRLYESLCSQTNKNFKWLIVDDGSSDNTRSLIESWVEEKKIDIIYIYQENAGKSAAHNVGVENTDTELFTCVDSDDYLTANSVEEILESWSRIKQTDNKIGGLLLFKMLESGEPTTIYKPTRRKKGTLKSFYDDGILAGDTMLVFEKEKLKWFSFPTIDGEKFVPEAYLYDEFNYYYDFYLIPEYLYICDYLEDGYTKNMARLIANNPNGYRQYIIQRLQYDEKMRHRFSDTIRYVAISFCHPKREIIKEAPYRWIAVLMYMPGFLLYLKRYKKFYVNKL